MKKTKSHVVFIRNVSKGSKDSLKRLAKKKNQSVQGFLLSVIEDITTPEIELFNGQK